MMRGLAERTHFGVSQPQAWSGTAAHQGFGGGNTWKLRAALVRLTAAAVTGSGGLHVKEHDVRTAEFRNRRTRRLQWCGGSALNGRQRRHARSDRTAARTGAVEAGLLCQRA
jgi:hypothetical protein